MTSKVVHNVGSTNPHTHTDTQTGPILIPGLLKQKIMINFQSRHAAQTDYNYCHSFWLISGWGKLMGYICVNGDEMTCLRWRRRMQLLNPLERIA